uniref:Uncharacterized protein n=1 Tax=Ditylenchus dipsaci TaxID=166011 RepID=A0A915EM64_9BILA
MSNYTIYLHTFVLLALSKTIQSTFSPHFRQFLTQTYGAAVDTELAREDVGGVHGITNTAGTFARIQQFFLASGYKDEEVYGTTYGDGGKTPILFIRMMITAVAQYTNSKVNVIGYSMGSPIARKAIMGGICADTNENIGHLFLAFCNLVNGMACGSRFLNDINSRPRYEADNIYTIFSTGDDKVGYQACGRVTSQIQGENQAFPHSGLNHDQVMFDTVKTQFHLVTYNKP